MKAYRMIFAQKDSTEVTIDVSYTMGTLIDAITEYCKNNNINIDDITGLQVLKISNKVTTTDN